ncbi:MAG TPA: glycosyltransferase [Povalibacter sp.]
MKVFYHKAEGGNVGDDLNAVLWQRLLPELDRLDSAQWLVGIGTILDERLNALDGRKVVMGTGLRPGRQTLALSGDIRIGALRGKLTAARLGLEGKVPLGDPGFLIGAFRSAAPVAASPAPDRVALVPHVYSERWSKIADVARDGGLEVISPTLSLEDFLAALARCSRVYCESLHAAIFAEVLRIPWARVRISSHHYEGDGVAAFKWRDAFSIVDTDPVSVIDEELLRIRKPWARPAQAIAERRLVRSLLSRKDDAALFRLCSAELLEERTQALLQRVQQLRSREAIDGWPQLSATRESPPQAPMRVLMFPKQADNPYVRRFSTELERAGVRVDEFSYGRAIRQRFDVMHMHWPDSHVVSGSWWGSLAKHARFAALLALLRLRRTRIIWMMHNLKPHDANHPISAWLFPRWVPHAATHIIALSAEGLRAATALYPSLTAKPSAIVPHCHYREDYEAAPPQAECRNRLDLPQCFTFLFFGNIRRYKNVPRLIEAFRGLSESDVQLVIAGLPGHGISAEELHELTAGDERIRLRLEFIRDEDVPLYFGAANVVVLPFDDILNSGSVLLALSFNRVVLAPQLGVLPEIQDKVGTCWLRLYDGVLTSEMLREVRDAAAVPGEADLSAFDWNSIADRTLELYRRGGPQAGQAARNAAHQHGSSYETPENEYSKS